jgi:Fur family ferric uptake transcriptional regulator
LASTLEQARQRVRETGARVTDARGRVLAALMSADAALSHAELQRHLEHDRTREPLDRVTLYRVLEWLVETGLAHRVSGPDRVWRFSVQPATAAGHARHGHFKCVQCGRMFCMKASQGLARTVRAMLPEGFSGDEVELTVLGRCAGCAAARAPAPGAAETVAR